MKVIKQKNTDFRQKIDAWRKGAEGRKKMAHRAFEYGKKIREKLDKYRNDFNIEKEKIIECILNYDKLMEFKDKLEKEERITCNFLAQLPDNNPILEIKDVEKILENENRSFKLEMNLLRDFIAVVKTECVLNHYFFSFYDIPELIIKKRYQKKDYEQIIRILNKTKKLYLLEKAKLISDKPVSEIEITDEDLVPLELLDQALTQKSHKFEDKKSYVIALI